MDKIIQFKVEPEDQGERLDKFLILKLEGYSRAALQKLIKDKKILVGGKETKASAKLKAGDIIEADLSELEIELLPDSEVKFKIIHDEKDFAVIDKPAGLVVYPATGHKEKTLVNGLLAKWPEIKNVGEEPLRPGIVHRLDKDTSGLMIIAKNNEAFQYFKNLFKERKLEKTYTALVYGWFELIEGKIDFPIRRSATNPIKQVAVKKSVKGGPADEAGRKPKFEAREAVTYYKALKYFTDKSGNHYTLVEAMPKTGRMHQIRVHFAALGHVIVGDEIYKPSNVDFPAEVKRHLLHASRLKFVSSSGKQMEFLADLPDDFSGFLGKLKPV